MSLLLKGSFVLSYLWVPISHTMKTSVTARLQQVDQPFQWTWNCLGELSPPSSITPISTGLSTCSPTNGMHSSSIGKYHCVGCNLASSVNCSIDNHNISSSRGYTMKIEYVGYWPTLRCHVLTAMLPLTANSCMSIHAAHTPNGKQGGQSLLISFYQYCVSGHLLIANFNSHTFD